MTRSHEPIEPMDLENMRQNGVRSLDVQCNQCRHKVIVNVDHLPGHLTVPSFGPRMVCTFVMREDRRRRPAELARARPIGHPASGFFGLRPLLSFSVLLSDHVQICRPIFAAGDSRRFWIFPTFGRRPLALVSLPFFMVPNRHVSIIGNHPGRSKRHWGQLWEHFDCSGVVQCTRCRAANRRRSNGLGIRMSSLRLSGGHLF
jgi:hypothetical protein